MSQRTPSHWLRDPLELAEHRLLERGVAVVQLERVRPAIEVRVAPVRQDARALSRLHAAVVLRRCGELLLRARHEEVRVLGNPARGPAPCGSGRSRGRGAGRDAGGAGGAGRAPRRRRSPRAPGSRGSRNRSRRRLPRGSRGGRGGTRRATRDSIARRAAPPRPSARRRGTRRCRTRRRPAGRARRRGCRRAWPFAPARPRAPRAGPAC